MNKNPETSKLTKEMAFVGVGALVLAGLLISAIVHAHHGAVLKPLVLSKTTFIDLQEILKTIYNQILPLLAAANILWAIICFRWIRNLNSKDSRPNI